MVENPVRSCVRVLYGLGNNYPFCAHVCVCVCVCVMMVTQDKTTKTKNSLGCLLTLSDVGDIVCGIMTQK